MSGFDKAIKMRQLRELGWTDVDDDEQPYNMRPPQSLFDKAPDSFHVYDAETLQNILGEALKEEERQ